MSPIYFLYYTRTHEIYIHYTPLCKVQPIYKEHEKQITKKKKLNKLQKMCLKLCIKHYLMHTFGCSTQVCAGVCERLKA